MSNLSTTSLPEFTDLVERTYIKTGSLVAPVARQLYIVDDLSEHTGEYRRYNEIDTETFASLKPQGSEAVLASVQAGYEKTMKMRRFAKEISITWEMRRLNKYPEVMAQLTSLSEFCPQRIELDLTHRITFGTLTAYTDMDGEPVDVSVDGGTKALFSTTHTLTGSASTYSNFLGAEAFGGFESAELLAVTNMVNNMGDIRVMNFDVVFSTNDPTLVNLIKTEINSTANTSASNAGVINVNKDKYRHVILPYLATTTTGAYNAAKKDMYGIVATTGVNRWQAYLGIWEQPHLLPTTEGSNAEDRRTDNWLYDTRGAWGICVASPRGIILGGFGGGS